MSDITFTKDNKQYNVRITDKRKNNTYKKVYEVIFTADTVINSYTFKKDVSYCLKKIRVTPNAPAAQCREYFDLLDFKGEHLREILLYDDRAKETIDYCTDNNGNLPQGEIECITIEPFYEEIKIYQTGPDKIIDYIKQTIAALDELDSEKNRNLLPKNAEVSAHRDLKFENILLDNTGNVRLIDFASIKIVDDSTFNDTYTAPMSPCNTPPEYLIDTSISDKVASTGGTVEFSGSNRMAATEKSDVFALGLMLYNGITKNTPLTELFNINKVIDQSDAGDEKIKKFTNFFNRIKSEYDSDRDISCSWIEEELKRKNVSLDFKNNENFKSIFYESTRFYPDNRLTIEQFKQKLNELSFTDKNTTAPAEVILIDGSAINNDNEKFTIKTEIYHVINKINFPAHLLIYYNINENNKADLKHSICNDINEAKETVENNVSIDTRLGNSGLLHAMAQMIRILKTDCSKIKFYIFTDVFNNDDSFAGIQNVNSITELIDLAQCEIELTVYAKKHNNMSCRYTKIAYGADDNHKIAPATPPVGANKTGKYPTDKTGLFLYDESGKRVYIGYISD